MQLCCQQHHTFIFVTAVPGCVLLLSLDMWLCLCCPVQDLNAQPLLLEQVDAAYDAVLCINGLQYLTQPEAVLTEVRGPAAKPAHTAASAAPCLIIWRLALRDML
jgi:hypothetical protein